MQNTHINTNEVTINATNNVVSNDVLQLPKHPVLNIHVLESLEQKRIEWEDGAYRKSNAELYGILADCLSHSLPLNSKAEAKARLKALENFHKARGYAKRENTPLSTKVVRAVFGNIDRRRTSVYSLVIRAALEAKVAPCDLPDWIIAAGGVEEIRLASNPNHVTTSQKVDLVKTSLDAEEDALAVVHSEALSMLADNKKVGQRCVLLAEHDAEGVFSIQKLIYSDGAVNAALLAAYAEVKKQQSDADATAEAVSDSTYALAA